MSYTNKFEQPSSYQPQSWPPRPHARFAHIPHGLAVLARINTWQDPALIVPAPVEVHETKPAATLAPDVLLAQDTPELLSADDLPESTAFFAQELEQDTSPELEAAASDDQDLPIEPNEIKPNEIELSEVAAQLGQAPQYQAAIREAVQKRAKALRAKKTVVTQWHLVGNNSVLSGLPSLHLWAMANYWGQTREEKLVVIDATSSGPELAQLLGWDCAAGWSDLLTARAALSETMHATPWTNVTLIPRGSSQPEFYEETCLRQASALGALQRDYRAVWILTAGVWDEAAQVTSQHVRERQLIVPLNCPASTWRELNAKLVAGNVLINGWVALGATASDQRRAA